MTLLMCSTPSPPNALEQAAGGFCLATEPETMTSTAKAAQRGAVSPSHSPATKTEPKSAGAPRRVRKAEPFFQLSCTNEIYRNGRRTYRGEWFQVPEEYTVDGDIRGMRLAREILALIRDEGHVSHEVRSTIASMIVEAGRRTGYPEPKTKRHAALSASNFLFEMLVLGAQHFDWDAVLRERTEHAIRNALRYGDDEAERQEAERSAFVQRMKAARAAKRAARQAEQAQRSEGGAA